jgi:hypothetical protein
MNFKIVLPLTLCLISSLSSAQNDPAPSTIDGAREAARIQFERDIGVAETELLAAKIAGKAKSETLETLRLMIVSGHHVSRDVVLAEMEAAKALVDVVIEKKARLDFLRAEAARLHIPIATIEKPAPSKPSFAPVRNRANEPIILKAATETAAR